MQSTETVAIRKARKANSAHAQPTRRRAKPTAPTRPARAQLAAPAPVVSLYQAPDPDDLANSRILSLLAADLADDERRARSVALAHSTLYADGHVILDEADRLLLLCEKLLARNTGQSFDQEMSKAGFAERTREEARFADQIFRAVSALRGALDMASEALGGALPCNLTLTTLGETYPPR